MKYAIDSMYGAGGTLIADIFTRIGVAHAQIRSNPDPLFPGINPEPIEPNIRAFSGSRNGCAGVPETIGRSSSLPAMA